MTSMSSNKKEEIQFKGEDITPTKDGCLLKEIVREGSDDETPLFDDKVFIHYNGLLLDGTIFESSRERLNKVNFNLGKGDVLKAWDIGVATMKRGEVARFLSKPKYAYGLKGLEGKVESATSVIFEIELFDFEGRDISKEGDQSILRRIVKKGDGYETPNEDATVEISLKGKYQNQIFDERTVNFIAGAGCVQNIPVGVEHAVFRMTKNEHCKLYLKSKATEGVEKFNIPPDTPVEYEATMIKFERAKEERELNDDQKLEQSQILKQRADEWVKAGYYELAVKRYKTLFNYLLNATLRSESDNKKSWQLKFAAQLNLALCYLKLGNYPECKRSCNSALAFDSKNEKALFRRGQCQLASRNYNEAIEDFQTVLTINPANVAAIEQIQQCQQEIKAYQIKEKEYYNSLLNRTKKTNIANKTDETKTNVEAETASAKSS